MEAAAVNKNGNPDYWKYFMVVYDEESLKNGAVEKVFS